MQLKSITYWSWITKMLPLVFQINNNARSICRRNISWGLRPISRPVCEAVWGIDARWFRPARILRAKYRWRIPWVGRNFLRSWLSFLLLGTPAGQMVNNAWEIFNFTRNRINISNYMLPILLMLTYSFEYRVFLHRESKYRSTLYSIQIETT